MSITQALSNALTGLNVAKRGAEVASSNIANALTDGYGRRELHQTARDYGGMGAGVYITGMTRHENMIVTTERRLADADFGLNESQAQIAKKIGALFGDTGALDGIMGAISRFETKLISAAGDPSDMARQEQAVRSLEDLATSVRSASSSISKIREQADAQISRTVDQLNAALKQVDEINDDITRLTNKGQPVAGLFDQRQQVIDSISEIVPLRQVSRDGGRIALMTASGEMLVDHRPRVIGFAPVGTIGPEMSYASGALSGLTIDGNPVAGDPAVGMLKGGRLEAQFQIRDDFAPKAHEQIDLLANSLMERLSDATIDPATGAPNAGLLQSNPIGATTTGLAARLYVNSDLLADPSKLRDGLGVAPLGLPGDSTRLKGWLDNIQDARAHMPGARPLSLGGLASDISTQVSEDRLRFETQQSYATAKRESLVAHELAEGVDTDIEMQKMMQLEQAYAANAKVLKTIDQMMRHILEI